MTQADLIWWTAVTGVLSALATGLGALPVALLPVGSRRVRAFTSAFAGGMMISASVFSLAQEGIELQRVRPSAPYEVILGLLAGGAFFWGVSRLLGDGPEVDVGADAPEPRHKRSTLLFVGMFIHSIPEGMAIGVGFATGDLQFGILMALAISVHNIPEGIAISLPLRMEGASLGRCATMSILSSVPQPLLSVPSGLLVWFVQPLLPGGMGFAGGAMIYLVFFELIPDALEEGDRPLTAWGALTGLVGMLLATTLLARL